MSGQNDLTKVAVKYDGAKADFSLLPSKALEEVAHVYTYGATKYSPHNWRKGFRWSRLAAAMLRHTFSWLGGEDKDPETGRSHLAHAICTGMMLLETTIKGYGEDDRHKEEN